MTTQSNIARKNQGGAFQRHASGRAIRDNIYGNVRGYIGRKMVYDFGQDASSASEWLEKGEWLSFAPDCSGRDAIYSVSPSGTVTHRLV